MKKIVFALLTAASVFAFVSCSSDDDKGPNCNKLLQNVIDATEAYFTDPSTENEQALQAASDALEAAGCQPDVEVDLE